jgi:hypothetical protein
MGPFDHFRQVMEGPFAPQTAFEISVFLVGQLRQACLNCSFKKADIYCGGSVVTLFLTEQDAWEAVIVGPNAYQFYPGFLSSDGETIVWPNIWVADDYDLVTFVRALEEAFEHAARARH